MNRSFVVFVASISILFACAQIANAEGYCPSNPGGKCPTPAKKISKSRSDFTPEQRKKIMEDARKVCVKEYGASSTVYRFDYKKWKVTCNTPGM